MAGKRQAKKLAAFRRGFVLYDDVRQVCPRIRPVAAACACS